MARLSLVSLNSAALGAALGFSVAGLAAADAVAMDEADEGLTVLHLSQTAERAVRRDRLHVQLRAEVTASDPRKLQSEINRMMGAAIERAKTVQGLKVETSGYAVYEEPQNNQPSRWRGSQEMSLLGADFGNVLALAGDLQALGLVMSNLTFELAPETASGIEDELTTDALRRLRQRAERVAGDLQLKLVRLRDVKIGNVDGGAPRPEIRMRAVSLGGAPGAVTPPTGEAGDAVVQVSVSAEILLGESDRSAP